MDLNKSKNPGPGNYDPNCYYTKIRP